MSRKHYNNSNAKNNFDPSLSKYAEEVNSKAHEKSPFGDAEPSTDTDHK